jgi:hypothetical protein
MKLELGNLYMSSTCLPEHSTYVKPAIRVITHHTLIVGSKLVNGFHYVAQGR